MRTTRLPCRTSLVLGSVAYSELEMIRAGERSLSAWEDRNSREYL